MKTKLEITIKGESGSGKTRLTAWLASHLRIQGHHVVVDDGGEGRPMCPSCSIGRPLKNPCEVTITTEQQ